MEEDGNYKFLKPQIFKLTYDMSILCTTLLFFFERLLKLMFGLNLITIKNNLRIEKFRKQRDKIVINLVLIKRKIQM